ncbi:MAG: ABC transporter substrate-binding protein [Thermomicrobiales bacterium]
MRSTRPEMNRRTFLRHATTGAVAATSIGVFGGSAIRTAAAAPATALQEPKLGGTLTLSVPQKTSFSHFMHMRHFAGGENIYSRTLANARLVTLNQDRSEFLGDLAERWEFSEDGMHLTFFLRQGLTWHDGEPFTSADVNFTYHMIGIPGVNSTLMGSLFSDYVVGMKEWIDGQAENISGLTMPDEYTVTFALHNAFSDLVLLTLFNQVCIAPNHVLSAYLDRTKGEEILRSEWATTANHIGLGPFKVVEYEPDQFIVYEPFENYYRGKPLLDQVIYRSYQDATTNAAALQNKEIDAARLPAVEYERFKEFDFLNFHENVSLTYSGTPFNTRQPYLNKQVRQALFHAIDREAMAQTLYAGAVEVVHSPIAVPQYGDSPNLAKFEYDPERAQALLAEGGWDSSRKIRWAVAQIPDSEQDQAYYAAINGFWEAVGVQAEFQVFGQDSTVLWGPGWDFDLYPSSYPIGIPASIAIHLDPRLASYVSAGFDTPEFVALWDAAQLQAPDEEMQATIWGLQEMIADEALSLMIVRSPDIWAVDKRVHGLTPAYFGYEADLYDWQLEKVWVE